MNDSMKPQQDAWAEDWRERVYERVHERRFSSVTDFVESRPQATLLELADELGSADVAAVQLEWCWVEEAMKNGAMERCARGLLTRALRRKLPEGWHREWNDLPGDPTTPFFRKIGAFASFAAALRGRAAAPLPKMYADAAERVRIAFDMVEIPEGWLPENADDSIIIDIFRRHWKTS